MKIKKIEGSNGRARVVAAVDQNRLVLPHLHHADAARAVNIIIVFRYLYKFVHIFNYLKSLNLTAQELLASALGLFSSRHPANDLSDCFGLIESSSADEMLAAVREQDVIDEAMWK